MSEIGAVGEAIVPSSCPVDVMPEEQPLCHEQQAKIPKIESLLMTFYPLY